MKNAKKILNKINYFKNKNKNKNSKKFYILTTHT